MRARRLRGLLSALVLSSAFAVLLAAPAFARPTRRFFQPTDLQLEDPGVAELDLQLDYIRGHDTYRLVVPDFEFDVGLLQAVEFDVDGAVALEDTPGEVRSLDNINPDNLWVAGKVAIIQTDEGEQSWGVGLGVQAGPKLPTAPDTHGLGGEGLALIGLVSGPIQIIFNVGAFGDPPVTGSGRPIAFEGGADVSYNLDPKGGWSLKSGIGAVHFFSDDPDQLTFMAGVACDPTPWLELSVMGLAGTLAGGDRYGVVLGFTPKFRLWN